MYGDRNPYASGYPQPPDIYLTATLSLNPETGELATVQDDRIVIDSSMLISWDEIEYLEFLQAKEEAPNGG